MLIRLHRSTGWSIGLGISQNFIVNGQNLGHIITVHQLYKLQPSIVGEPTKAVIPIMMHFWSSNHTALPRVQKIQLYE